MNLMQTQICKVAPLRGATLQIWVCINFVHLLNYLKFNYLKFKDLQEFAVQSWMRYVFFCDQLRLE